MTVPIRVLHVIGIMNRGGAETFIMNVYRAVDRNKIQFDFVEGSSEKAAFDEEIMSLGGRVYRCPRFTGKNIIEYRKWWKTFFDQHAGEYAAVHGHIGSTAAIYLSLAKKYGLHTIAHSHGEHGPLNLHNAAYRVLSYPTRHIADDFLTCSIEAGISRFGNKVPLMLVRNGIDTDTFRYDPDKRAAVRKEMNISSETVFGHVGRFTAEKNHKKIINVFHTIYRKDTETRLILIGDGPLRKEMEEYVRSLNLDRAVCFLGVRNDVYSYLNAMDVLLFPSLHEGLPVSLVEAQCSGLHCLISKAIPESVVMDHNLIQFMDVNESDEAWAVQATAMAKLERTDGREAVIGQGFDIRKTAQELEKYYCQILD